MSATVELPLTVLQRQRSVSGLLEECPLPAGNLEGGCHAIEARN